MGKSDVHVLFDFILHTVRRYVFMLSMFHQLIKCYRDSGVGDLGSDGIAAYVTQHICNDICNGLGLKDLNRSKAKASSANPSTRKKSARIQVRKNVLPPKDLTLRMLPSQQKAASEVIPKRPSSFLHSTPKGAPSREEVIQALEMQRNLLEKEDDILYAEILEECE